MTRAERDKYLAQEYRNLFSSNPGINVLTDILYHLGYFLPTSGEGPQACNNEAKVILSKCGAEIAGAVYTKYEKLSKENTDE